jgi:hypothetical protein
VREDGALVELTPTDSYLQTFYTFVTSQLKSDNNLHPLCFEENENGIVLLTLIIRLSHKRLHVMLK